MDFIEENDCCDCASVPRYYDQSALHDTTVTPVVAAGHFNELDTNGQQQSQCRSASSETTSAPVVAAEHFNKVDTNRQQQPQFFMMAPSLPRTIHKVLLKNFVYPDNRSRPKISVYKAIHE